MDDERYYNQASDNSRVGQQIGRIGTYVGRARTVHFTETTYQARNDSPEEMFRVLVST
jgi:hypothetical protein